MRVGSTVEIRAGLKSRALPLHQHYYHKRKGEVVPVLNYGPRHEDVSIAQVIKYEATKTYWRSGGVASRILNLGTRWK
jgi:hypothetical protein